MNLADYITPREFAAKHKKTYAAARKKLFRKQIPGAVKAGQSWLVPRDAPWPEDGRKVRS